MSHIVIVWIAIGATTGWIAGLVGNGSGFCLLIDIAVGIVGAFIGAWLSATAGIATSGGAVMSTIVAIAGAVILLIAIRLVRYLLP
ncbi:MULTISPECIES: GlsB/YeaQ/YmgE family stress response membrane protein [unclassified Burkholderia]|uniref:GlsB/YeaQ/YmgE family stress response membrane protein n=1 Tax=unclassified Burkholderia TaxID=2613784 RepID=UPI002AB12C4B|nr:MULTISPECIES: GlsB/YeaQ/YmgE family stress response membrane protein [unclassified Burkholderia]